jgi:chaperonin cofactor prefoldin
MQRKASKENELRQFLQLQNVLDKEIQRYDEIMNELANISKVVETAEASEEIQRLKEL